MTHLTYIGDTDAELAGQIAQKLKEFDLQAETFEDFSGLIKRSGEQLPDIVIINAELYSVSKQLNNFIHIVKKGDTLYSISKQYGVTLDNLVRVNQIKDQIIFLDQELKIPIKN